LLLLLETGRAVEERSRQGAIVAFRNHHPQDHWALLFAGIAPHQTLISADNEPPLMTADGVRRFPQIDPRLSAWRSAVICVNPRIP